MSSAEEKWTTHLIDLKSNGLGAVGNKSATSRMDTKPPRPPAKTLGKILIGGWNASASGKSQFVNAATTAILARPYDSLSYIFSFTLPFGFSVDSLGRSQLRCLPQTMKREGVHSLDDLLLKKVQTALQKRN
jgi:hypothetical protein